MRYRADITGTPLCLRETRIVATHLLQNLKPADSVKQIVSERLFGYASDASAQKTASALHKRLSPFCEIFWEWIRSGDRELTRQSALASVIERSYLVGDFMDLVIREQLRGFERLMPPQAWSNYVEDCLSRDPELSPWRDSTIKKLKSVTYSMLVETGYLQSIRNPQVQRVFVDNSLAEYLKQKQKPYILRCLEVSA